MRYFKWITLFLLLLSFDSNAQWGISLGSRIAIVKSINELTPQQKLWNYIAGSIAVGRIKIEPSYVIGVHYCFSLRGFEIQPEINYAMNKFGLVKTNYNTNPNSEYSPIQLKQHMIETNLILKERIFKDLNLIGGVLFQKIIFTKVDENKYTYNNSYNKIQIGIKGGMSYKINNIEVQVTDQFSKGTFAYNNGNDLRNGQVITFKLLYNVRQKKDEN